MTALYVIYTILTIAVVWEFIEGLKLRARLKRLEQLMDERN